MFHIGFRKIYGSSSIAELERAGHHSRCTMRIRPASVRPFCFVRNPQRHRSQSGKKGAAKWNHANRQSLKKTLNQLPQSNSDVLWQLETHWNQAPFKRFNPAAGPWSQSSAPFFKAGRSKLATSAEPKKHVPWCWEERTTITRFGLKRRPVDHLSHSGVL